jgi:hypothetical protein
MEHGFLFLDKYSKKNHFNVVLFSIGYSNRDNYVVAQLSPPQGRKNQIVGYVFFFFGITLGWPPNSPYCIREKKKLVATRSFII